ncbi:NTP transferase domain-containing protein, partial [Candidatus Peribacteria bacterium]|nr:NTP transferase domain-containing protein [Candidatus Peribacteria bacterium]
RLKPLTDTTHKSLLKVGGKPLIHYPLKVLLDAGITDIMLITGPTFAGDFMQFLGSGAKFGCDFTYRIQDEPKGIAHALALAESFADEEPVCAMLGDNIFANNLSEDIKAFEGNGGHLFLKEVDDPERFGVAETAIRDPRSAISEVISLEEKPETPKSNLAVTGCYLFAGDCFEIIKTLNPSDRGELEITDVSKAYLDRNELTATVIEKDWIDAGTFEALERAEEIVKNI